MHIISIVFFVFFSLNSLFASEPVKIQKNLLRTTFETVTLPSNVKPMGLMGINFLRTNEDSNFYYGPGVYGSLTGERGGFFAGGVEIGYEYPLSDNLSFDLGAFLGGGSGANSDIFGDGLMLRGHAGLNYDFGSYSIGGYYSKVKFPGSKTDSNHVGFQFDIPFETVTTNTKNSKAIFKSLLNYNDKYNFGWKDHHIALTYQYYNPPTKAFRNPSTASAISLVGFEYRQNLYKQFFTYLEASMAGTGNSAGYAEILGGIGYNIPLSNDFGFNIKAAVGSGGGGGVDVEGGLLYKFNTGVYYKPSDNISLDYEIGYVDSPQGNFSTLNNKISLSYSIPFLTVGKGVRYMANLKETTSQTWRFRTSTQHYMASSTIRQNKKYGSADLMAFKFDRFLTDNVYLTGHGFGAYRGDIAGYGGGFMGIGYNTDPFVGKLSAYTEFMIGVGGAGGVDAGEGLLVEPTLGLSYNISKSLDFQVGIGKVKALSSGNLDETIIEAGLSYKFNTIEP